MSRQIRYCLDLSYGMMHCIPLIPVHKAMERFHICPVYVRMNGHFVRLKKFWVDKFVLRPVTCQMTVSYICLCVWMPDMPLQVVRYDQTYSSLFFLQLLMQLHVFQLEEL